jgi:hypothetical protein
MGHNRSALLAGLILTSLGMPGADAVALLRQKRQGALYNKTFASYLQGLPQSQTPCAEAAWLSGGRAPACIGNCWSAGDRTSSTGHVAARAWDMPV